MDAEYIKQTVGEELVAALTSMTLHVPPKAHLSPYSTSIDPITYVGHYLLQSSQKKAELKALQEKQNAQEKLIKTWKDSIKKENDSVKAFRASIVERVSVIKARLDADDARENAAKQEALAAEPIAEEKVEPVAMDKPEGAGDEANPDSEEQAAEDPSSNE